MGHQVRQEALMGYIGGNLAKIATLIGPRGGGAFMGSQKLWGTLWGKKESQ